MKSSAVCTVHLNKAIALIKYIILCLPILNKYVHLTTLSSLVPVSYVLNQRSQSAKLLLKCLSHFCDNINPLFQTTERKTFGYVTQWEEGWEVRKPRINTGFPLPALQNSEKNINIKARLPNVFLSTGVPLACRHCHQAKGIWICLSVSPAEFSMGFHLPIF